MSTSLLLSARKALCRFSIPLSSNLGSGTGGNMRLERSTNHIVLWSLYGLFVFIYSIPAFELVRTLSPGDIGSCRAVRIHDRMLVIEHDFIDSEGCIRGRSLYIWDLLAGKHIGTAEVLGDDLHICHSISRPIFKMAETENPDDIARQGLSKESLLIVSSYSTSKKRHVSLRIFMLPNLAAQPVDDPVQQSPTSSSIPLISTTSPLQDVFDVGSMGGTAVTGGRDGIVCLWDITSRECQLNTVLIGHVDSVDNVDLDEERVYSSSFDSTVRVWDRHTGDCLHILEDPPPPMFGFRFRFLLTCQPYPCLVTTTRRSVSSREMRIWDVVSGNLIHQIEGNRRCCLGPTIGQVHTIVTWKRSYDPAMDALELWDARTGKLIQKFKIEARNHPNFPWCFQDRFLIAMDKKDRQCLLTVWDFGVCDSSDEDVNI